MVQSIDKRSNVNGGELFKNITTQSKKAEKNIQKTAVIKKSLERVYNI